MSTPNGWHKAGRVWALWRGGVALAHVYLYPPQAPRSSQVWTVLCGARQLGSSPRWEEALRIAERALAGWPQMAGEA